MHSERLENGNHALSIPSQSTGPEGRRRAVHLLLVMGVYVLASLSSSVTLSYPHIFLSSDFCTNISAQLDFFPFVFIPVGLHLPFVNLCPPLNTVAAGNTSMVIRAFR